MCAIGAQEQGGNLEKPSSWGEGLPLNIAERIKSCWCVVQNCVFFKSFLDWCFVLFCLDELVSI